MKEGQPLRSWASGLWARRAGVVLIPGKTWKDVAQPDYAAHVLSSAKQIAASKDGEKGRSSS